MKAKAPQGYTAKWILQLSVMITAKRAYCYWCGQGLRECGMCKGSGQFRGTECKPCKGHGNLCPTHEGDWD